MTDPELSRTSMTLEMVPTGGPFGVFVEGLVLDSDDQLPVAELKAALGRHGVLVFRGAPISAPQFVALGRAFGELEILPEPEKRHPEHPEIFSLSNVLPDGDIVTFDEPQAVFLRGTERWHTDSSFREIPCLCTMLNAITVPPEGGDTEFADMVAAYGALPEERQAQLAELTLVHSYEFSRANNPGEMVPMSAEDLAKYPPVHHPLVRQHPDGRRSLYMGAHASHIDGMGMSEGRELLAELADYAGADRFVYRHSWQANDLVVWDNRSTLHRLRPYDIAHQRRVMQRITVAGSERVVRLSA